MTTYPRLLPSSRQDGQVLVAGMTTSTDLPGRAGGSQADYAGGDDFFGGDGFVTRFPAGLSQTSSICATDATTLCLSGRRFAVRATWRVPATGKSGTGTAVSLGSDTGYFWFFDQANIELVVKVLDARTVNGHSWVFYGALSDVEYHITVTDTDTGITKTYDNPSGRLGSVADTAAFSDAAAAAVAEGSLTVDSGSEMDARSAADLYAEYAALTASIAPEAAATGGCAAGGSTLCLNQARFQVAVDWTVPGQGKSGHGVAIPLTGDTGILLVLRPGERRAHGESPGRPGNQRQVLGLLRRALERPVHDHGHRHGDANRQEVRERQRNSGERGRYVGLLSPRR